MVLTSFFSLTFIGAEAKGFVSPRPIVNADQSKKQNFDKSKVVVDTSSIASPFGKGPSLTDVPVNSSKPQDQCTFSFLFSI